MNMPEDQMLNMDKVVFLNEHVSLGLCHWFESVKRHQCGLNI